jgi:putative phosphoesterase
VTLNLGVIADTHGMLRPQAVRALAGVELIVHAGDIGRPEVLDHLRTIAPVQAVRGNMDFGEWAYQLPPTRVVSVGEVTLYVLHDRLHLDLDPAAAGFQAVIYGHTHQAEVYRKNEVLYLNPGAAGPQRSSRPLSVARLELRAGRLEAEIIELDVER